MPSTPQQVITSPVDYIAMSVQSLLAADPTVISWLNGSPGRVVRRSVLAVTESESYPFIIVAVVGVQEEAKLGLRMHLRSEVGVFFCFETFTRNLDPDETSAISKLEYMLALLDMKKINAYAKSRWPSVGNIVQQLAFAQEFGHTEPIPLSVKGSAVAMAAGLRARFQTRVTYPDRQLAE